MQFGVFFDRAASIFYHFNPASDFAIIGAAAIFFFFLRIFLVKVVFGVRC